MRIPSRLFPVTVEVPGPFLGFDDYGTPLRGRAVETPARLDTGEKIVRTGAGTQEIARVTVRMPGDISAIETAGSIVIPGYGTRPIIAWKKIQGSHGIAYTEVSVS